MVLSLVLGATIGNLLTLIYLTTKTVNDNDLNDMAMLRQALQAIDLESNRPSKPAEIMQNNLTSQLQRYHRNSKSNRIILLSPDVINYTQQVRAYVDRHCPDSQEEPIFLMATPNPSTTSTRQQMENEKKVIKYFTDLLIKRCQKYFSKYRKLILIITKKYKRNTIIFALYCRGTP